MERILNHVIIHSSVLCYIFLQFGQVYVNPCVRTFDISCSTPRHEWDLIGNRIKSQCIIQLKVKHLKMFVSLIQRIQIMESMLQYSLRLLFRKGIQFNHVDVKGKNEKDRLKPYSVDWREVKGWQRVSMDRLDD